MLLQGSQYLKSSLSFPAVIYGKTDCLLLQGNDLSRQFLQFLKQDPCSLHAMIAVDSTHGLVIQHANFMDLCRQFRELSVIFHGRFVYRDDLETLSKNATAYKI